MSKLRDQVREFHRVFEHPMASSPTELTDERLRFRLALIAEEFVELMTAAYGPGAFFDSVEVAMKEFNEGVAGLKGHMNLPEVADALADLDYVVEGMRLEMGISGEAVADEVHRSNMSKLGDDGRLIKRADGKTIKGPRYFPPDIAGELRRQGWKG